MVLGSLLGLKDAPFSAYLRAPAFSAASLLYVGLQGLHDYQRQALDALHVKYTVQTESQVSTEELKALPAGLSGYWSILTLTFLILSSSTPLTLPIRNLPEMAPEGAE